MRYSVVSQVPYPQERQVMQPPLRARVAPQAGHSVPGRPVV